MFYPYRVVQMQNSSVSAFFKPLSRYSDRRFRNIQYKCKSSKNTQVHEEIL